MRKPRLCFVGREQPRNKFLTQVRELIEITQQSKSPKMTVSPFLVFQGTAVAIYKQVGIL